MADFPLFDGTVVMELTKRGVGAAMIGLGLVFFAGGLWLGASGVPSGYILPVVAPGLLWFGAVLMSERLVVTSEGVYHVTRHGLTLRPKPVAWATWSEIKRVDLVVKRSYSGGKSSTSYTLVFERSSGSPLRYLMGFPSRKGLVRLQELLKERNIPAKL